MMDDFVLCARAVEKNKTSIKSRLNHFLQPTENDLSLLPQPKWFLTPLPIPRLEAMPWPHERPNGSHNNDSRPLFFIHVGGRMGRNTIPAPFSVRPFANPYFNLIARQA